MGREEIVTIESTNGKGRPVRVDRNTSYEALTDMTGPSEARLELGDNGTWSAIRDAISIGRQFRLAINDRSIVTGRLLARTVPTSADSGTTVQISIRTALADAAFTSCNPVNVQGATLESLVLNAYSTIGVDIDRFEFNADMARNVLTGRGGRSSGAVDLAAITEEDARVQPPETVFAFVDRHLRRFGLMHWDGPDGTIVFGKPNDTQPAIYTLQSLRASPRGNNVISATRTEDYEGVPSSLSVYGRGSKWDYQHATIKATLTDPTLSALDPTLPRQTMVLDESVASVNQAIARAKREMAERSRSKDAWEVTVRGWTFRDASGALVPWATDTVSKLVVDSVSSVSAPYYIWRVHRTGNVQSEHTAQLSLSAQGVWSP